MKTKRPGPRSTVVLTPEEIEQLGTDYLAGWGLEPLARRHHTSEEYVRSLLIEQGVTIRKPGGSANARFVSPKPGPTAKSRLITVGYPLDSAAKTLLQHFGAADCRVLIRMIEKGIEGNLDGNQNYRREQQYRPTTRPDRDEQRGYRWAGDGITGRNGTGGGSPD